MPVRVHEADRDLAMGKAPALRDRDVRGPRPRLGGVLPYLVYAIRKGMFRIPPITEVATFGDGATLDVPGSPRVIFVPGHTPGSAALHVPARDAIFVGDAFAMRNVLTGAEGPQTVPQFNADTRQALASLDRLAELEVGLALPGHGQPWRGSLAEAARLVRASVPGAA